MTEKTATTNRKREAMMRKVRALLAQAEDKSVTPEEAEAFSRKAEELIAAYAIDVALLAEKSGARGKPTTVRVKTEKNYRMPFVTLLTGIADAFGVKPILDGRETVILVGFEADLDMVQTLYGSLLMQAVNSMATEARRSGKGGNDLWAFKQSFVMGFANKVWLRLKEIHQAKAEASEPGTAIVLRDRRQEVDEEVGNLFPNLKTVKGPKSHDQAAYAGGVQAGARADIGGTKFGGSRAAIA